MTTTADILRAQIDKAAREAAIASWDAFGFFVTVDDAYCFVRQLWSDDESAAADFGHDHNRDCRCEAAGSTLPDVRPAEFGHDYRRYCRNIAERNPFIMCDCTRQEAN